VADPDRDEGFRDEGLRVARTVSVAPERLAGWLSGFAERHGEVTAQRADGTLTLQAADGAAARLRPPFPWLSDLEDGADAQRALLDYVSRGRTVGALLVRRGGVAVGVFAGRDLVASKVESGYVQGRTKAGGWSQQRYARRRGQQTRQVYDKAADLAVRILLPRLGQLDAVATGGDRPAIAAVLADPRLAPLEPLVLPRTHPVPDPRLAVLRDFPEQFLAVEVELNALA